MHWGTAGSRSRPPLASTSWSSRRPWPIATTARDCTARVDPADGRSYVYGMSFMDAAPSVFACFDQPDLKAPYTLARRGAHGLGGHRQRAARPRWRRASGSRAPPAAVDVLLTLVAGPYHLVTDEHDGIPLGLYARRQPRPAAGARTPTELLTVTRQCFDELHRLFGIRYPFGDYHQAFVPEFNAGAMENPGCITFRDPLVFTSRVTALGADQPGHHDRPRDGAPVVRQPGHAARGGTTCGSTSRSPSTSATGSRPTRPSTPMPGTITAMPAGSGVWSPTRRPSTHPVAGNGAAGRVDGTAELRRHLLHEGLRDPQAARHPARRRSVPRWGRSTTSSATASATQPCPTWSATGSAPAAGDLVGLHRRLADVRRRRPAVL